ncbi:DUF4365 domain-containing protein [Rossellomorea sp. DA94]|uniref:DUF4365 domain-containing protein n=1 Tax=Rossellomorea sp. DA94 TaxID=3038653 RepID=UPI00244CFF84|nr:DUF4365 domain-containing protein [Rossellomorea sp. DA94]WGG46478.1 DUF4365 domain-containing protein [Rossellomorea sp. DA94]
MSGKEQRTESEVKCLNKVAEVVRENFRGEFIEFPHRIDNGFDGVIVWRENGNIIDVIYVQCKGGDSYFPKNLKESFRVQNISKEDLKRYKRVWDNVFGPAIMVVTNSNKKAWWIDLKSSESYDNTGEELFCKEKNYFNSSARLKIRNLISKNMDKYKIPELVINNNGLQDFLKDQSLKTSAKDLYRHLATRKLSSKCSELDNKIEFTRIGWRHITRKKRDKARITQSLILLPLVREIIENATEFETIDAKYFKDNETKNKIILDKLVIKAQCIFNYRFPAIIKVVLLRKREITKTGIREKVWFYSIYEARRKRGLKSLVR